MSRVLTASDICERGLRAIGSFPMSESAPDGEALREAMTWLDLIMGETVGTERMFSRIASTMSLPIVNGTQAYDLYTALGSDLPPDRLQFIVDAWLEDADGNRCALEIVGKQKFENVERPDETGRPRWINIDIQSQNAPVLRTFPTVEATDPQTYFVKLIGQRYAPNVAPGGVTGTQPSGSVLHEFGQAWQRWLVLQLSHDLGSGPIIKLPEASLNRFGKMATDAKTRLDAFENRPQDTTAPIGEAPSGWLDY